MKAFTKLYISAFVACSAATVQAQTAYNVGDLMQGQLQGTARFVGMGGAMSALGGDISTMSTNPAGIGLYRSSDVAVTFGWVGQEAKSNFYGEQTREKDSGFSFDQAGFVYSSKIGNRTSIRFFNFGFNYRKQQNFDGAMSMAGWMPTVVGNDGYEHGLSYTQNMAQSLYVNGLGTMRPYSAHYFNKSVADHLEGKGYNMYGDPHFGWLNVMGALTGAVNGAMGTDDQGHDISIYNGWDADRASFFSTNSGGIYAYDFNMALNIEDRVYVGLTMGVYDVDYNRYSLYKEDLYGFDSQTGDELAATMELENWYHTEGSGLDVKLGVIVRPFEYSPFRIGLAIHTPTWYNLRDIYSARLTMRGGSVVDIADTRDNGYGDTDYEYELRTPWKFNVSAGYTFGRSVAVDAEYEYADYSSAKLSDSDGYDYGYNNDEISASLKGVSTFKVGMEAKLLDNLSLRLGYNYNSALYDKAAYKLNDTQGTRTDIDYQNTYAAHTLTGGLGFRLGGFYADIAYAYMHQKADFYPYSNIAFGLIDPVAEMKYVNNRMMVTLGYRF